MITHLRISATTTLASFMIGLLAAGCSTEIDDEATASTTSATSAVERYDEVRALSCTFASRTTFTAQLPSNCDTCKVTVLGIGLGSVARAEYDVPKGTYNGAIVGRSCGGCAERTMGLLEAKGGDCRLTSTSSNACRSLCQSEAGLPTWRVVNGVSSETGYCQCGTSIRAVRCGRACRYGFSDTDCGCKSAP